MIKREKFQRYLLNHCGCKYYHGDDVTLEHNGNHATLGKHDLKEVTESQARSFLIDLGFTGAEYNDICDYFGIPHH